MNRQSGITGIETILEKLPEGLRQWYHFGNILDFRYYRVFDDKNWQDRYDAELVLTDDSEAYHIRMHLKNIAGSVTLYPGRKISGLEITNMCQSCGFESSSRYQISDFESNEISIYCEEIEVGMKI